MARKKQIKRGRKQRSEKAVILIGTEGRNKTERQYFRTLSQDASDKYSFKFARGKNTDPVGVVMDTVKDAENMCTDPGDKAFAVFDTDADVQKQPLVDKAVELAKKNSIEVITSTPCFEVWFLQHFRYSTHPFNSGDEVLRELRQHVSDYEKSKNVYESVSQSTEDAIERAKALEEYHDTQGRKKYSIDRNPSALAFIIVDMLVG